MPTQTIPPVHLTENLATSTRQSITTRAYPLGEPGRPSRADGLQAIVRYLDVEHSPRYQRTPTSTFCNIYACDYCYLAGVYLPRVWWTPAAMAALANHAEVPVKYADTVVELSANSLYEWLVHFSPQFGWTRVQSLDDLQAAANAGQVALICAQPVLPARPGHIVVVAPEDPPQFIAQRNGTTVTLPLQSQAGARNFCFSCGVSKWWAGSQFREAGFWIHA